jgi:Protein of unknown function (DUF3800)
MILGIERRADAHYALFSEALRSMADVDNRAVNTLKMSTAVFDESGKWTDIDGVFVFAGFVTFPVFMEHIVQRWVQCLADAELPIHGTSMKDAMAFQGIYRSFVPDRSRRDGVIRKLAAVIAENADKFAHLATPLGRTTTEEFARLPQEDRRLLRNDPYYGSFEGCIRGILETRSDTQFHIVCDLAEQYSEKCVSVFHELRKRDQNIRERCLGIAFSDDEYYPPLQIADMLAYCHRAFVLKQQGKEYKDPLIAELVDTLGIPKMEERSHVYRLSGTLGGIGTGELQAK